MNIKELEKELAKNNIPMDAYCFSDSLPNERFCICKIEIGWEIYYSERGRKSGVMHFNSETMACEYFLKWIKKHFKTID